MTPQPLARVALRTEVLEHPPGHEPVIRRCSICNEPFCTICRGADGGEPCYCEAHLRTHGREVGP